MSRGSVARLRPCGTAGCPIPGRRDAHPWHDRSPADPDWAFAVCPGSVDTEMLKAGRPGAEPDMSAEDVMNVIVYLAIFAPAAMTGAAVDVFG